MIRVGVQEVKHVADVFNAGLIAAASAYFGEHSLSLAIFQPLQKIAEYIRGFDARAGGAGTVRVEILVDVEDEVGGTAVGVGDASKGGC